MDIGDVAKQSQVPASTLRYYEEKGLIRSIGRNGLRRYYSPDILQRLALISLGRKVGLTLDEIGRMLLPKGVDIDRQLLLDKADALDKKIQEMASVRDGLRHAAACQAPSHLECPKFLKILNLIGKKWTKTTNKLKED